MLRMERTESIPLSCMKAGMRWDWESFPEYLDSLERGKLGVNAASLIPYSPLRAYAMGNDAARDPKYQPTTEEIAQIKYLIREGLEAGGFGFSGSFSMANRDYDGGYLPTHVATREEFLGAAQVLREFNRGSIEWTMGHSLQGLGMDFLLEMAKVSGRPLNWNAVISDPSNPDNWKRLLEWNEKAFREAVIFPVNICVPIEFEFTMETIGLFDQLPAWNAATIGTFEERKAKLGDPMRRAALRMNLQRPFGRLPGLRRDCEVVVHVDRRDADRLADPLDAPFNGRLVGISIKLDFAPCQGAAQRAVHSPGDRRHNVVEGRGDRGAFLGPIVFPQGALHAVHHRLWDFSQVGPAIAVAIFEPGA